MTKYKLIKLPDATIVVSDEEIIKGDGIIRNDSYIIDKSNYNNDKLNIGTVFRWLKIIAGLPDLPIIKYMLKDEDAKRIGYFDVEVFAISESFGSPFTIECQSSYKSGFQKAMELNDKEFSEDELLMVSNYLKTDSLDEVLKFLKKPQIFDCEIELEQVNNIHGTYYSENTIYKPKIENNCITVTKIL